MLSLSRANEFASDAKFLFEHERYASSVSRAYYSVFIQLVAIERSVIQTKVDLPQIGSHNLIINLVIADMLRRKYTTENASDLRQRILELKAIRTSADYGKSTIPKKMAEMTLWNAQNIRTLLSIKYPF